MKIGEFSKKYKISIKTIRYYVSLGLLNPIKLDKHWNYTESCEKDLLSIIRYKACGFSLKTISELFNIERNTSILPEEKKKIFSEIYTKEKKRLLFIQQNLDQSLDKLNKIIMDMGKSNKKIHEMGIPLEMFSIVYCPYCNKPLSWTNIQIVDNSVFSGEGYCYCGYKAEVKSGILISSDLNNVPIKALNRKRETYKSLTFKDISALEKRLHWCLDAISKVDWANKIIYEDVINVQCFLNRSLGNMNPEAFYILSDTDFEVAKYYKDSLQTMYPNYKFFFIVDDGIHHPLKKRCLHLFIDSCSSEILQRYQYESAFPVIEPYMYPDSFVIGYFSYYKKRNLLNYPSDSSKPGTINFRYQLPNFIKSLTCNGVTILKEEKDEYIKEAPVFDGSSPGDKLSSYLFLGQWIGIQQ